MFSREKKTLLFLAVSALLLNPGILYAAEDGVVSVDAEVLPINVANPDKGNASADMAKAANTLVSPTKPNAAKVDNAVAVNENKTNAAEPSVHPAEQHHV